MAMRNAKQRCSLSRFTLAVVVISLVALVLMLSITVTSGAGRGYDQIALALPIFFVLLFLATSIGDWLQSKDLFIELKPRLSTFHTRAPPA